MDFLKLLESKKSIIWPELQKFLPEDDSFHSKMVRDYPERGGKYLRAGLVLLACEAFGGDPKKAVRTAAAMEASQNWILIHDDIQDHSDERRGKPCLHNIVGEELALNAGDALHVIMWKILMSNKDVLGVEMTFKIMDEMSKILDETTVGQTIEMQWIADKRIDLTDEDYYKIIDTKAGLYTITGPMVLGAMIAGAEKVKLDVLYEFGKPFGRAFQIQDDVLNLTAGKEYGKEIGGDILEGKRTLMLAHLVRNCTDDERKKVDEIYKKQRNEKTKDDVKYVLDLMEKYKSIEYARNKAKEFVREAEKIFDTKMDFLKNNDSKVAMRTAIDFVASRNL